MAGARLMKLKAWSIYSQQIARKASYTQRSGPSPKCRASLARSYKGDPTWRVFFLHRLFYFVYLILDCWPDLLQFDTQPPLGALVFSPVNDPMKWEMCSANMCLLPRNHKREVFKILCKATQLLQRIHYVRTGGVPAHSKDLIYNQCHSTLADSV